MIKIQKDALVEKGDDFIAIESRHFFKFQNKIENRNNFSHIYCDLYSVNSFST